MPWVRSSVLFVSCDVCGRSSSFRAISLPKRIREYGWGLSKDYKKVYCPICLPNMTRQGPCGNSFKLRKN